jgi:hypothetical protein
MKGMPLYLRRCEGQMRRFSSVIILLRAELFELAYALAILKICICTILGSFDCELKVLLSLEKRTNLWVVLH